MDLMISTYEEFVVPHLKEYNGKAANGAVNGSSCTPAASFEEYKTQMEEMMTVVRDQRDKLAKEVARWCAERGA